MKQAIAIFIIFALLFQTFSKTFVVADYFLNTASYAKNCENKARPGMHCNGKCQMMKKIKQQENSDKQNQERKSDNKSSPLSSKSSFANSLFRCFDSTQTKYPEFNCGKTEIRPRLFFHPPDFFIA